MKLSTIAERQATRDFVHRDRQADRLNRLIDAVSKGNAESAAFEAMLIASFAMQSNPALRA